MTDIVRPTDLTGRVWAEDGSLATPRDVEILEGWEVGEKPPAQVLNYWQNRTDNILSYLLQKGMCEWDTNEDYIAFKSFCSKNGDMYLAKTNNQGVDPELDALEVDWKLVVSSSGSIPESDRSTILARANHTGSQAISTVTGLQSELDLKESLSNKVIDFDSPNNTTYPTTQAVVTLVSGGTIGGVLKTEASPNVVSSSQSILAGKAYDVDSSAGSFTLTLPASPVVGDYIWITDIKGTWDDNPVVLARNGNFIERLSEDMDLDRKYWNGFIVFIGGTYGWVLKGA